MSNRIYQHQQQQQQQQTSDDDSSIGSSVSLTLTESTPLLVGAEEGRKHHRDYTTVRLELKWLLCNSLPIIGTYLLQNSFQLASIFTLGHLVKRFRKQYVRFVQIFTFFLLLGICGIRCLGSSFHVCQCVSLEYCIWYNHSARYIMFPSMDRSKR